MNAFGELIEAMKIAGKQTQTLGAVWIRHGTVLRTQPLEIDVAGTSQEAGRFYVCHRLLVGHSTQVKLQGEAAGSFAVVAACANGSHNTLEILNGTLTLNQTTLLQTENVLNVGDEVLMLTQDDQTFYLVDKVVHL